MEQINNSRICCATCSYWLGARTPDRLGFVTVQNKMDRGQCSSRPLSEHYIRQAVYSCSSYSKWSVLR